MLPGPGRQLLTQARLPDPRLAHQHRELRDPAGRHGQELLQLGQFRGAADERPGPRIGSAGADVGAEVGAGQRPGRGGPSRGTGDGGRPPDDGGVPAQDRALQFLQRGPRIQAQLVGEDPAHLPQRLQGIRLPVRTGQRHHPQEPEPFAQRMLRRQRLQLRRDRRVPAEGQKGGRSVLERDHAQLGQPRPFRDRGGQLTQLDVRDPPPRRERGVELSDHLDQLTGAEPGPGDGGPGRAAGPGAQALVGGGHGGAEPGRVEGAVGQPKGVTGRDRDDDLGAGAGGPVGFEGAAQARDVDLQGRHGARRRRVAPQQIDEGVDGHRPAAVQRERREHLPLLAAGELDRLTAAECPEGPQYVHPHGRQHGAAVRPLVTRITAPGRSASPDVPVLVSPACCR